MQGDIARRRVLIAARPGVVGPIRQLFEQEPLVTWETVEADSFAQARFVMQHSPCDIALVHEELLHREGEPALSWIARNPELPVVFLTSYHAETMTRAYRQGVSVCLPRDLTLLHPWLLDTAMERVLHVGRDSRRSRRNLEHLQQCRRQIDRLVHIIWRSSPMQPDTNWFTQRHTIERLQEEIARTKRHGAPLTLAVSEVRVEPEENGPGGSALEPAELDSFTSTIVSQSKRRCDVAGQYGMQGFLLLMVHTPSDGGVLCCRRLKELLEKAAADSALGPRGPIRAYFGLASSTEETVTAQGLLRCAEQNLETAKTGKDEGVVAG